MKHLLSIFSYDHIIPIISLIEITYLISEANCEISNFFRKSWTSIRSLEQILLFRPSVGTFEGRVPKLKFSGVRRYGEL